MCDIRSSESRYISSTVHLWANSFMCNTICQECRWRLHHQWDCQWLALYHTHQWCCQHRQSQPTWSHAYSQQLTVLKTYSICDLKSSHALYTTCLILGMYVNMGSIACQCWLCGVWPYISNNSSTSICRLGVCTLIDMDLLHLTACVHSSKLHDNTLS